MSSYEPAGRLALLILLAQSHAAFASDACSTVAIHTTANVDVSDGSSFRTESFFHSAEAAAIRHFDESIRTVAVEGPNAWTVNESGAAPGGDFHRQFALGHQFHAFIYRWDDIVANEAPTTTEGFDGHPAEATSGDMPWGGRVHRFGPAERPQGFVLESAGGPRVETVVSDWRPTPAGDVPFRVEIDDGERIFVYRFETVEIGDRSPLWFMDALAPVDIDAVALYRLHRRLLAAHCLGDAEMMATLSAPSSVIAGRGDVSIVPREDTRRMFTSTFERWDYHGYHDLRPPIIEVAESGDLGWVTVNVRAEGISTSDGSTFSDVWAWVLLAKKIDGAWLQAGNASSIRTE